jgi:hypothetical protein
MVVDQSNTQKVYYCGSDTSDARPMLVSRSTNGGISWTRHVLNSDRGYAHTLAISPNEPNLVYTGGYCYTGQRYVCKVFKSSDAGQNWTDFSSGFDTNDRQVYDLAFDPFSPNSIYAISNRDIYKSVDGGAWNKINPGHHGTYNSSLLFSPNTPNTIYLNTSNGVYISSDSGKNWSPSNDGLKILDVTCLQWDGTSGLLFAGTSGAGVYRKSISALSVSQHNEQRPDFYRLNQNYPNPFNMTTTIEYQLPKAGFVELGVYNILGQKVATLVEEHQDSGCFKVHWDGRNNGGGITNSGIYIYKIKAGNFTDTKKLILLK